jgi:hypothetical protein
MVCRITSCGKRGIRNKRMFHNDVFVFFPSAARFTATMYVKIMLIHHEDYSSPQTKPPKSEQLRARPLLQKRSSNGRKEHCYGGRDPDALHREHPRIAVAGELTH